MMLRKFLTLILCGSVSLAWGQEEQPVDTDQAATAASATVDTSATLARPTIFIAGKDVMASARKLPPPIKLDGAEQETLKDDKSRYYINKRIEIVPYKHNPMMGEEDAPLTIIEFSDLACLQCMGQLAQVDAILEQYANDIRRVHIYAPTDTSSPTQLAPFYGKVAQHFGKFWDYRKKIQSLTNVQGDAYFDLATEQLDNKLLVRRAAMNEAPKFYRELDADSHLFRKLDLKVSPLWVINGVRVGQEAGLPMEKLQVFLQYEKARITALQAQDKAGEGWTN
jgi:hypothetical protein